MKTESSTTVQREQSAQRSQAHHGRTAADQRHNNPFAQLLAGLGTEPAADVASTEKQDESKGDNSQLSADSSPTGIDPSSNPLSLVVQNMEALAGQDTPQNQEHAQGVGRLLKEAGFPQPGERISELAHADTREGPPSQAALNGVAEATLASTDDVSQTEEALSNSTQDSVSSPKRGKGAGLLSTAELQSARAHAGPGQHVASAAQTEDRTQPPPQALAQASGSSAEPVAWHMLSPGQPASALNQSTDASAALSPDTSVTGATPVQTTQSQAQTGGDNSQGLGTGTSAESGTVADLPGTEQTAAPDFAQNLDQAMDSLGAQVSYWASNHIRRATMRLDAGLKEALEVDVRIKDGAAQLDFRTNDTVARQLIQSQAPGVLSDLLARSGIGLEGVSVGAGNSGDRGHQAYNQSEQSGWTPLVPVNDRSANAIASGNGQPATRSRQAGSLDVFA